MESLTSTMVIMAYITLIALYIVLIVKFWKASTAIVEMKSQLTDISYRDTVRYIAEMNSGKITDADRREADELFNH